MRAAKPNTWMVGEIENNGEPVLVRHRLHKAGESDPNHQWLVILTHHLAKVQANGLPEPAYNDSLQQLDGSVVGALQPEEGDQVVLIETCHGKRHYYAYVRGIERVGRSVQCVIAEHPEHTFSYRTVLDSDRQFAQRYIALLDQGNGALET